MKGKKSLIPYLLLSLLIHLALMPLLSWAIQREEPSFTLIQQVKEKKAKKELAKKREINEKHPIYVKILEMPKPKVEEIPEKSHIIAQYTMKKKGPKGKQEPSALSGESPKLNPQPGLPITPPKPKIAMRTGKGPPLATPKLQRRSKGEKEAKEGEKPATKEGESEKKPIEITREGGKTQVVPPLPKRKIPLFNPEKINEMARKIMPEFGEGESAEISLDTTKSKYISYFKHIKDKLYLVWRYPLEAKSMGIQGTAHILFVIDKTGELNEVRLLGSSGSHILDNEALRAIRAASPFGPFPQDWREKELRIKARFIYRLFSGSPFR